MVTKSNRKWERAKEVSKRLAHERNGVSKDLSRNSHSVMSHGRSWTTSILL